MGTAIRVNVKPKMLRWARKRAGLGIDTLARDKSFKNYPLWEAGKKQPTLLQMERFAKITHIAIGDLFLSSPPEEAELPIPDFRTMGNKPVNAVNPDLLDIVDQCLSRQDWYHEYLVSEGEERPDFVGSARLQSSPRQVAKAIRSKLGLTKQDDWEEALNHLVERTEEIGILVMISGVVGNDTTRRLDTDDFRGFALVDDFAPLIFINGRDAKAAQMFTLAHELAHIWLGKPGISNPEIYSQNTGKKPVAVEQWCNKVAAEILVPTGELKMLSDNKAFMEQNAFGKVKLLSKQFQVSSLVSVRRLYDEKLITRHAFKEIYEKERAKFLSSRAKRDKQGGGNFYNTMRKRLGNRFSFAIISSTLSGNTLYTEALDLLGIEKLSTFDGYAKTLGY